MVSACFLHRYRCAVYLNNAATTFIARGDYQEACITSREAISMLETIVRPPIQSESAVDVHYAVPNFELSIERETPYISKMVHQVEKRLATLNDERQTPTFSVEVLCFDGSIDSRNILEKKHTKDQRTAFPIWISDLVVSDIDDSEELFTYSTEIVPVVALLNYAISSMLHYKCTKNQKALDGTIRLFHMAMQILRIRDKHVTVNTIYRSDFDNAIKFMEERLFVANALLRNFDSIYMGPENPYVVQSIDEFCNAVASSSNVTLWYNVMYDLEVLQDITDELIEFTRTASISSLCLSINAGAA